MSDVVADFPSKEREVPKVLLPMEYAMGWRSTNRNNASLTANISSAFFEEFESNGESIQQVSSADSLGFNQIKLSSGKAYKLSGEAAYRGSGLFSISFQWKNITEDQLVGSLGACYGPGTSTGYSGRTSQATAFVYLEQDCVFELSCKTIDGAVESTTHGTCFIVESLQNLTI